MNSPKLNLAKSDHSSPAARAEMIAASLAEYGAHYDAEPAYPINSMDYLLSAGLHIDFAPIASGGCIFASPAAQNFALMKVLRIIGRADLSIGRLYEGHINALTLFDHFASPDQQMRLKSELEAGIFYGVWATEPASGTRLGLNHAGQINLYGSKSFASGAGGIGRAIITAKAGEKDRQMVIVEANDPLRADLSNWRVRGMRATMSGLYDLSGIQPQSLDMLGQPGDYDLDPLFTTGAWRFTAVQLGGIEALLIETRRAMSEMAQGDPLQRAKFAEAVAATRTAYLWVRECALRAATGDENGPSFAQMTRGIVERAGLDVMELAARIIGTRSAMDGQRIDKITRDLSLYLRQAGPDYARDQAALAWLDQDIWGEGDALW